MLARKQIRIAVLLSLLWTGIAHAAPASSPASPAPVYRISKTYTTLSFTATKWMVFKEEGIFQDFSGTLSFDQRHPEAASIEVTVQAASINTQNDTRDGVLRSDDFFDVARYPALSFRSASVRVVSPDQLEVTGDLMIHGITKRVTVPVTVIGVHTVPNAGDMVGFETRFTIDRRDFGVLGARWSSGKLAIDYSIEIHLLIGGVRQ